jgi:serine/threonine protein kinase
MEILNFQIFILIFNNKSNKRIYKLSYLDSIQFYNFEDKKLLTFKSPSLIESPEMLNKNLLFDNSDLWSLGIIIYYLNYKEFPFKGNNEFQLFKNIKDNINNIKKIKDNELNELLGMMLKIDPKERISLNDYFSFFEKIKKKI